MFGASRYFLYPRLGWVGAGLIVIWAVAYFLQPAYKQFQFAEFLDIPTKNTLFFLVKAFLIVLLFVLTTVFLMRPQGVATKTINNNGIDIVLALDVSYSMEAEDFSPDRISVAREVLQQFVSGLEADRAGLIVFAGKPFVSVPLSFDYGLLASVIERTSTGSIDQNQQGLQGTAIGDALLSSLALLEESPEDREKVIVLLTDGEANLGVDPELVARKAQEEDVKVYTVGIGSLEGGMVTFETAFGTRKQRIPGVDQETLQAIAQTTNGKYWRATDASTFSDIFEELEQLEKSSIEEEVTQQGFDIGYPLLWWIALLLIVLLCESYFFRSVEASNVRRVLLWSMLVGAIIALINPHWFENDRPGGAGPINTESMIMLDVSTSMHVEDIENNGQKVSRILTAKTLIERYLSRSASSSIGFGIFAGEAVGVVPMSTDYQRILTVLGGVDAATLRQQGTNIDEAIRSGMERFLADGSDRKRRLILITDGGDDPVTLDENLQQQLAEKNIALITYLIGTQEGGPIPLAESNFNETQYKQYNGETVISRVYPQRFENDLQGVSDEVTHITAVGQLDYSTQLATNTGINKQSGLIQRLVMVLVWLLLLWYCLTYTRFITIIQHYAKKK